MTEQLKKSNTCSAKSKLQDTSSTFLFKSILGRKKCPECTVLSTNWRTGGEFIPSSEKQFQTTGRRSHLAPSGTAKKQQWPGILWIYSPLDATELKSLFSLLKASPLDGWGYQTHAKESLWQEASGLKKALWQELPHTSQPPCAWQAVGDGPPAPQGLLRHMGSRGDVHSSSTGTWVLDSPRGLWHQSSEHRKTFS